MRQALASRIVRSVTVALLALAGLFALLSNATGESRVAEVLGLDADLAHGEALYMEISNPTCASCHSLSHGGAESNIASDLDELRPSARVTVQSLIGGTTPQHDREDYRHDLSNQDLADLARYIEAVAGE